jgi:hypothetical protein
MVGDLHSHAASHVAHCLASSASVSPGISGVSGAQYCVVIGPALLLTQTSFSLLEANGLFVSFVVPLEGSH